MTHSTRPDDPFQEAARRLCEAGDQFYRQGWLPATSGNLSIRLSRDAIAITVSGTHKGRLKPSDIMMVNERGEPIKTDRRPSAETLLHTEVYRWDESIGAVFHTHSVHATMLSKLHRETLRLSDYELLKAFAGVETHESTVTIPVFQNDQDIFRLAQRVKKHYDARSAPLYGFMIEGHGLYTWGKNDDDARRHVEAFEFLFECEILKKKVGL